jgi:hypothetical protein
MTTIVGRYLFPDLTKPEAIDKAPAAKIATARAKGRSENAKKQSVRPIATSGIRQRRET